VHQLHGDDLAVALAEDAVARAVLTIAVPDDDEAARAIDDAGPGAVLTDAGPDDGEVAGGIRSDGGAGLVARNIAVDRELRTERTSRAGIALAANLVGRPAAVEALPRDDDVARRVGGDGRPVLAVRRIGVDAELRARGPPELA
jgi:hypothetical protein